MEDEVVKEGSRFVFVGDALQEKKLQPGPSLLTGIMPVAN
jgi:hypothetical protein